MARNSTQYPDTVKVGVAVSRAISYGTQGLPRSFADGRLRRSGCIYARMQPIPKLPVQVVRIGLAAGRHAGGMAGGLPRTCRRSIHASRNLSRASLCDRLRRPWTEPVCRRSRSRDRSFWLLSLLGAR